MGCSMVEYDHKADVLYVMLEFAEGKQYGARLDECRVVHSEPGGRVVGVEFLAASRGLNFDGVPQAERIIEELRRFREVTAELERTTAAS